MAWPKLESLNAVCGCSLPLIGSAESAETLMIGDTALIACLPPKAEAPRFGGMASALLLFWSEETSEVFCSIPPQSSSSVPLAWFESIGPCESCAPSLGCSANNYVHWIVGTFYLLCYYGLCIVAEC